MVLLGKMGETTLLRIVIFVVWVMLANGVGVWADRRGYGWGLAGGKAVENASEGEIP